MNLQFRRALVNFLRDQQDIDRVISNIQLNDDGSGHIAYSRDCVWIDPLAPGFTGTTVAITDEELVRAYLIARLATSLGYCNPSNKIELERVYRPVGRPTGKGGRVDILVRGTAEDRNSQSSFLFIECKAPDKFDSDLKFIDGQLFRLSMQEAPRPRYLVYYTVESRGDRIRERSIVIDTLIFPTFEAWDQQGQPILSDLPASFGSIQKILYGNVGSPTSSLMPLDRIASREQFSRLQSEIHDVIWGGGGTNNNEVFVYITKLILAKIYDEKETLPQTAYRFQRLGTAEEAEPAMALFERMNALYREAERPTWRFPPPRRAQPLTKTASLPKRSPLWSVGSKACR